MHNKDLKKIVKLYDDFWVKQRHLFSNRALLISILVCGILTYLLWDVSPYLSGPLLGLCIYIVVELMRRVGHKEGYLVGFDDGYDTGKDDMLKLDDKGLSVYRDSYNSKVAQYKDPNSK